MPPARTLVVFHSRTGHTRRVGKMLAARLKADVEEISTAGKMPGYLRCALQAALGGTVALKPPRHDPARYDLVVVGTPVWCWSLAAPVRGWLEQYGQHAPASAQTAFFCTMGGSGAARVFAQMQRTCGQRPRATLALTEAQLEAGPRGAIDVFVARLARGAREELSAPGPDAPARDAAAPG